MKQGKLMRSIYLSDLLPKEGYHMDNDRSVMGMLRGLQDMILSDKLRVLECEFSSPAKEVFPLFPSDDDGFKHFEPGEDVYVKIHLVRRWVIKELDKS